MSSRAAVDLGTDDRYDQAIDRGSAVTEPARDEETRLRVGSSVEVRSRFDKEWTKGFTVAELTDDGIRVRRRTDGELLPVLFHPDDIRRARKRSTWWV